MDLIEQINGQLHNLLPYEGIVHYYGSIMPLEIANEFYNSLIRTIQWENDEAIIYGKKIITKRKVAWYAPQPFSYTYSKITKTAKPWIPILDELKAIVEKESGETYNSCLLNLYHDGNGSMTIPLENVDGKRLVESDLDIKSDYQNNQTFLAFICFLPRSCLCYN